MLVVTGITQVAPEDADLARTAAAKVAEITRTEDGCFEYAFYEDVETPGRFRVYEEWRDDASLKAHSESAHIAEFRKVMGSLTVLNREIRKMRGCVAEPL